MPFCDKRYVFSDPEPGPEKVMTRTQSKLKAQLYAALVKPHKDIIASRFRTTLQSILTPTERQNGLKWM